MATSASSQGAEQPDAPTPPRPLLRRVHRNVPAGVWYALAALGFALLIVIVQVTLHVARTDPRNATAIVQRELRLNTLQPGERVVRTVPVFRRNAMDYYRLTRGMLVLTDHRLIYLGVPPRDITGSSDTPPAFDQREFPFDTLTTIARSFTLLGFSRALRVKTPTETMTLGVPGDAWPKARLMRVAWTARHQKLEGLGTWAGRVREARGQLAKIVADYRRQPVYHVVRPGDALGSIASWYEVPPDSIRTLNGIVGNKIKVGQKLLIRSGS